MSNVIIYTDGAARPTNPGFAASAFVVVNNNRVTHSGVKSFKKQTNNYAEIYAVILALSAIEPHSQVLIYSDSRYLVQAVNVWLRHWKKLGWKRKEGALKNANLFALIDQLVLSKKLKVKMEWVKSHNGNQYNELVDLMCEQAIDNYAE